MGGESGSILHGDAAGMIRVPYDGSLVWASMASVLPLAELL